MSDLRPPGTSGSGAAVRIVAVLVMIASVVGLFGAGLCLVNVIDDADLPIFLLILTPAVLFFAGVIWVCATLLQRLKT